MDTIVDDPLATAADSDGFVSLREAIQAANTNAPFGDAPAGEGDGAVDTITFHPSLSGQTIVLGGVELTISDDLAILGPGAANLTISGNGASRVFAIDASASAKITDVTISDGEAIEGAGILNHGTLSLARSVVSGNAAVSGSSEPRGGGISNGGLLSITHSAILANTSFRIGVTIQGAGGGIYNKGTLDVQDSVIQDNAARTNGGGISNAVVGTIRVARSAFLGNSTDGFNGGAIVNFGALDVADSSFVGNLAGSAGGAISNDGPASITTSDFEGNTAFLWGGAIFNRGSSLTLQNSTLASNSVSRFGGAIANIFGGTIEIVDSAIHGNFAEREGGGIENFLGTVRLENSTVSGNASNGTGGGIWNLGTLESVNSTIALNRADADGDGIGSGGGIFVDGSSALPVLNNTIVAGNVRGAAGGDSPDDVFGLLDSLSAHNLVGDAATSGGLTDGVNGNIVGNAGIGTIDITTVLDTNLADNGGPTWTHALVPGSPAIDAGDNALAVDGEGNPLLFDQRGSGFPRVVGGTVDFGAFEAPPFPLQVAIDIKPGSDENPINLASGGVIAVAILTTADFDAALVDVSTVVFAGASAVHFAQEDVDGDGDLDLVLHFLVQDTNLAEVYAALLADDPDSSHQSAAVSLTGHTIHDEIFAGTDFADLFHAGKSLRKLLDDLAQAGIL